MYGWKTKENIVIFHNFLFGMWKLNELILIKISFLLNVSFSPEKNYFNW
jgi:hypothetical protein